MGLYPGSMDRQAGQPLPSKSSEFNNNTGGKAIEVLEELNGNITLTNVYADYNYDR